MVSQYEYSHYLSMVYPVCLYQVDYQSVWEIKKSYKYYKSCYYFYEIKLMGSIQ